MNVVIRRINEKLEELCKIYGFYFISNDEICRDFLCDDGVHLLEEGTEILAGNFLYTVNNDILNFDLENLD